LDLRIGAQTEARRPEFFGFGETLFQLFILVASRRLQGDRFFTDSYDAKTYTQTGLDWIDDNSMKTVILRHMPELKETELAKLTNAFEPWKPKTGEAP
jgi:hypothetical protein